MSDTAGIPEPEGETDIIDTDYEIGQDNITTNIGPFGLDIHNPVFLISCLSVVAFVLVTLSVSGTSSEHFQRTARLVDGDL